MIMLFAFSNNLLQTKLTPIYAVKKEPLLNTVFALCYSIHPKSLSPSFNFL